MTRQEMILRVNTHMEEARTDGSLIEDDAANWPDEELLEFIEDQELDQ